MKKIHFGAVLASCGIGFLGLVATAAVWSWLSVIVHGFAWALPIVFLIMIGYGVFLAIQGYRERPLSVAHEAPSPLPTQIDPSGQLPTAIKLDKVKKFAMDRSRIETEGHGIHAKDVGDMNVSDTSITAGGSAVIIGNPPPPAEPPAPPPA